MHKRRRERQPNDLLRQERLLRGWTQQQVAAHVGTDDYTVGRWERGRAIPSPYFRQQLCELFGKDTEALGLLTQRQWGREQLTAASSGPEPGGQQASSSQRRLTSPSF